jgi:hypothetical protein
LKWNSQYNPLRQQPHQQQQHQHQRRFNMERIIPYDIILQQSALLTESSCCAESNKVLQSEITIILVEYSPAPIQGFFTTISFWCFPNASYSKTGLYKLEKRRANFKWYSTK